MFWFSQVYLRGLVGCKDFPNNIETLLLVSTNQMAYFYLFTRRQYDSFHCGWVSARKNLNRNEVWGGPKLTQLPHARYLVIYFFLNKHVHTTYSVPAAVLSTLEIQTHLIPEVGTVHYLNSIVKESEAHVSYAPWPKTLSAPHEFEPGQLNSSPCALLLFWCLISLGTSIQTPIALETERNDGVSAFIVVKGFLNISVSLPFFLLATHNNKQMNMLKQTNK